MGYQLSALPFDGAIGRRQSPSHYHRDGRLFRLCRLKQRFDLFDDLQGKRFAFVRERAGADLFSRLAHVRQVAKRATVFEDTVR